MADELIRLDTTIIGIDSLINKASTAEEAKVLFTVKDVIYSQQRYFTDVQPVKHGKWNSWGRDTAYNKFYRCSCCNYEISMDVESREFDDSLPKYCPNCGARMDLKDGDEE
jgi:hypothetical protein